MTPGHWMLALGLGVCGFWMVGAHNRIVGLRAAIGEAWARVDALLASREAALAALVQLLWEPWPGGRPTLDALSAARQQVQTTAQAVRQRPTRALPVASLAAAENALGATIARLLNQIEGEPGLGTRDEVAAQLLVLFELGPQLLEGRQRFNRSSTAYNAAIHQFPTNLLAPVFRFEPAGSF